jgi:hypothetical protein
MMSEWKARRLAIAFLVVLFAASSVAEAQLDMASLPFAGGSWTWGNAHRWYGDDDLGFNQLKWVWRLDLSTSPNGMGPWESPYFDTFTTGLWWDNPIAPEPTWALDYASPYYAVASGNMAGGPEWFSYELHFAGDLGPDREAGFNFGAFRNGVWVGGYTRHFGYQGSTWFSDLVYITEQEFDSYPPVPEPAWLSVVGLGLLGAYGIRRWRKNA